MATLTDELAETIAASLRDGFDTVDAGDVRAVVKYGSVDEGNVSPDYDDALTDAIIEKLDEAGVPVP